MRVRTSRQGGLRWALVALLASAFVAVPAAPAHAGLTSGSITMFSDPGEWIGGGVPRLFHEGNARITMSGTGEELILDVEGDAPTDRFELIFAPPEGQELRPRVYPGAQAAHSRVAVRPGLDISGDGRVCGHLSGSFEVKDIGYEPDGSISHVWLLYEQRCHEGLGALFGEVRVGLPPDDGPLAPAPSLLRWPGSERGHGTALPVTVRAATEVDVASVALVGEHPGDFIVRADECTGRELGPGDSCQVWVSFAPGVAGTRYATLRIEPSIGAPHQVPIEAFSPGGRTRIVLESDPGIYPEGVRSWSYTNADAEITAGGSRAGAGFVIDGPDGRLWQGRFDPAEGDVIAPGRRYAPATRPPTNGPSPGLKVIGGGLACAHSLGEFTVTTAKFNEDGGLDSFGATFEQRCEADKPAALRGTVEYRVGDTTSPPPWMREPAEAQGADPAGGDSVTMLSDSGDEIGLGGSRLFHTDNARIRLSGTPAWLLVEVEGGAYGDRYWMNFRPPHGAALTEGVYTGAQLSPFRPPGRPVIAISGEGRSCGSDLAGNFEIKDIGFDEQGAPERLWLIYAQHCREGSAALSGEVRVGLPGRDEPLQASPSILRWPPSELGRSATIAPVTLRATRSTAVADVALVGADGGPFAIRADDCSGRTLAAGTSCRVWVRFKAAVAGTHRAALHVEAGGRTGPVVALEGFSYGGRTRFVHHETGDGTVGSQRTYTNANAVIRPHRSNGLTRFDIAGTDGREWSVTFAPPAGETLVPGRYAPATFGWPEADFWFSGGSPLGCRVASEEFTVSAASFEPHGALRSFAAEFEQRCQDAEGLHRGTIEFRAGDTTPLPPWLGGPTDVAPPLPPAPSPEERPPPSPEERPPPAPVTVDPASPSPDAASSPASGAGDAVTPTATPEPTASRIGRVTATRFRRLTLARNGSALVTLACPAANAHCRGSLLIKRTSRGAAIGRAAFNVRPRETRRVRVRLTSGTRRLLTRRGSLRVVVQVREGAGTRTHRATIRAATRRR